MEQPKEILVIYRLKFKSEHDFEQAVRTLRFGQNMGKYVESLQRSFAVQRPQASYPMITPPEVNLCKDDLVIYLCSYELRQYTKGSPARGTMTEGIAERMPRTPYYYELILKGTFGPIADVSIAASEHV
ncbi:MAG: hypothetical protein M3230_04075 [Thermoproteota archaeon]|jgi:hypothetical protein|nr:hypothetical protein [Thermoproteota archaeon]